MICTITVNPCIDCFVTLQSPARLGAINRVRHEQIRPGGKGVNVAVMLQRLGVSALAAGFRAGECGELLEALLVKYGLSPHFIPLSDGQTRINFKIEDAPETAFNGKGPQISADALQKLVSLSDGLNGRDTLVLSGNVQGGAEIYEALAASAERTGARLVVDTSGPALQRMLRFRPFLIKPNAEELAELYSQEADSLPALIRLARRARQDGAQNVLVSMGKDGSLLLTQDGLLLRAELEKPFSPVSTVGAGDSLVAGFLAGLEKNGNREDALRLGAAAGTATACDIWLAEAGQVQAVIPFVRITRL